jgi:hypothetical protein
MSDISENMTNSYSEEQQIILADIEIARKNLYVYRDSSEMAKWEEMLVKAENETLAGKNYIYSRKLIERVNEATSNLWKRIFRWQDTQKEVTKIFVIAIPIELLVIATYCFFVEISKYGFYTSILFGLLGGTLGVALNIGKDLQIEGSNRLQILRLILRPFIGSISAIVMYFLLQTKILAVAPGVDSTSVLILLSIFAGFSERFITKAMSDYIPSLINKKGNDKSTPVKNDN